MADARIYDYANEESTKVLDSFFDVDKSGYSEAKKISLNNLRKRATLAQSETFGSMTVDFTNYEQINLGINGHSTITISNVPTNSSVILKIVKDAGNEVTFANATLNNYGIMNPAELLVFRIVNISGTLFLEKINGITKSEVNSSTLSSTQGTISSGGYFNMFANGNVATLACNFIFTPTTTSPAITVSFTKVYEMKHNYTPLTIRLDSNALIAQGQISEGAMTFRFNDFLEIGTPITILVSASIILA